jgi:membrane associated rhomboid family serine protease
MRLSGRKASSYAPSWKSRQRVVLLSLIGLNFAIFVVQLLLQAHQPALVPQYLGLSYRGVDKAYAWQFLTAMFLHAGVFQFAGTMIVLYVIGRDIEAILGPRHFLYLYVCGAIGGELGHLFTMPATTVLFGGSGAAAAMVIALAVILPDLELTDSLSFMLPVKVKLKYLGYALWLIGGAMLIFDRHGIVSHSAVLGGGATGWLYAHLLGFGRPSFLQRALRRRRLKSERRQRMSLEEFITEEIDPLLEKISQTGIESLTRSERRTLTQVREKLVKPPQ